MTADNQEMEEINHLLEVEKNATALVTDAMTEADKRLAEARAKYNEEVKIKVKKLTEKLTSEYNCKVESLKQNHQKEIDDYKSSLESIELNQTNFNKVVDQYLITAKTL